MKLEKTWSARQDELPAIAKAICSGLAECSPLVLWLKGDLGAGKTTLAKSLLRAMGLPENVPVLSPTFTWLTEYQTPFGVVAHMDLYRLADGDDDSVIMLLSGREYQGLIIEWPERAATCDLITPSAIIELSAGHDLETREIKFYRLSDH